MQRYLQRSQKYTTVWKGHSKIECTSVIFHILSSVKCLIITNQQPTTNKCIIFNIIILARQIAYITDIWSNSTTRTIKVKSMPSISIGTEENEQRSRLNAHKPRKPIPVGSAFQRRALLNLSNNNNYFLFATYWQQNSATKRRIKSLHIFEGFKR